MIGMIFGKEDEKEGKKRWRSYPPPKLQVSEVCQL